MVYQTQKRIKDYYDFAKTDQSTYEQMRKAGINTSCTMMIGVQALEKYMKHVLCVGLHIKPNAFEEVLKQEYGVTRSFFHQPDLIQLKIKSLLNINMYDISDAHNMYYAFHGYPDDRAHNPSKTEFEWMDKSIMETKKSVDRALMIIQKREMLAKQQEELQQLEQDADDVQNEES